MIILLVLVILISVSGCPTLGWHHRGHQSQPMHSAVIELHNLEAHPATQQDEMGGSAFPWSMSLTPSTESLLPSSAGDTAPLSPAAVTDSSTASVGSRVINCRCYHCPELCEASLCTVSKCHISPQSSTSGSTLSPLIKWL